MNDLTSTDLTAINTETLGNDIVTFLCPHCGVGSQHHLKWQNRSAYRIPMVVRFSDDQDYKVTAVYQQFIYQCAICDKATYILSEVLPPVKAASSGPGAGFAIPSYIYRGSARVAHQHPLPTLHVHSSVPTEVSKATEEAEKCFAIAAPNACAVMLRRAIDAICQEKGAEGKDLFARLKYLSDARTIPPDLWEWCEELRILGKVGAHPEWEDATLDEAGYALRFLRDVIRYVYVNPYERQQRKIKESKVKKNGNVSA